MISLIKSSGYKVMPWKNGLGVTAEIAIYPEGADLSKGDFQWRISSAKVTASNSFSNFSGYDRFLTVLSGEGFELNERFFKPYEVHKFRGEEAISCKLIGRAVEDLGIIYRRDLYVCEMLTHELHQKSELKFEGEVNFLYSSTEKTINGIKSEGKDTFKIEGHEVCQIDSNNWPTRLVQIKIQKRKS